MMVFHILKCPLCQTDLEHRKTKEAELYCPSCGWDEEKGDPESFDDDRDSEGSSE